MDEQLKIAELKQFVAQMVHDINNPLSVMLFNLECLQNSLKDLVARYPMDKDLPEMTEALEVLSRNTHRCSEVAKKLMSVSSKDKNF